VSRELPVVQPLVVASSLPEAAPAQHLGRATVWVVGSNGTGASRVITGKVGGALVGTASRERTEIAVAGTTTHKGAAVGRTAPRAVMPPRCQSSTSERSPSYSSRKFTSTVIWMATGWPFFMAGLNLHCLTASIARSSSPRPKLRTT